MNRPENLVLSDLNIQYLHFFMVWYEYIRDARTQKKPLKNQWL